MDNPAARDLMDMVRKINEIGRRARSGDLSATDYLRVLSSDPTTQWFTELLREKTAELEKERQRADQLTSALRAWHWAKQTSASDADRQLTEAMRIRGIIEL
jgi:hypothetical protein